MKRSFRFVILALMITAIFGSGSSSRSSAERVIDPACVSACAFELFQCFANGTKNNDHACISVYRRCIAQCGKHD